MATNVEKAWIATYSGKRFHILDPKPEDIDIVDIAHSLSQQGRFTGHTRYFYSIAQHSYYVSQLVPKELELKALLHDASEAYVADINRPAKYYTPIGPVYKEVEEKIQAAIFAKFGLTPTEPLELKHADRQMMWAELLQLFPNGSEASEKWGVPDPAPFDITCWMPRSAESVFLSRFRNLIGGDDANIKR